VEQRSGQKLALVDRKSLDLEGVLNVDSFDEREIILDTNMGKLFLKGEGLHVVKLNLEEGTLSMQGFVSSIEYKEGKTAKGKGKSLLKRIMK